MFTILESFCIIITLLSLLYKITRFINEYGESLMKYEFHAIIGYFAVIAQQWGKNKVKMNMKICAKTSKTMFLMLKNVFNLFSGWVDWLALRDCALGIRFRDSAIMYNTATPNTVYVDTMMAPINWFNVFSFGIFPWYHM